LINQGRTHATAAIYTSWTITCHSPEEAQSLKRWLSGRIDLDRVLTATVHTYPNAVEQEEPIPHYLGDYFADIQILLTLTPSAFRLVFQ
jgi:hypothetical protein